MLSALYSDFSHQHPDLRANTAVIRPTIGEDQESFLSYYLTSTPEDSDAFISSRQNAFTQSLLARYGPSFQKTADGSSANKTTFHFTRDYETVKIDVDVPNEFMFVLDDGNSSRGHSSGKGAYYKNIERKYVLKKKRQNVSIVVWLC